jgi:hypothetical protein
MLLSRLVCCAVGLLLLRVPVIEEKDKSDLELLQGRWAVGRATAADLALEAVPHGRGQPLPFCSRDSYT